MTAFRFHALTTATVAATIEAGGRDSKAASLLCVRHGDIAAIVSPAPRLPAFLTSRRALAQDLVAFQRVLEAVMVFGPIVPAAYRATFADRQSVLAFLAANQVRLHDALAEFGDKRQFQISIGWNPTAMLRLLGGGSDFQAALVEAARTGVSQGQVIQRLMEAQRATMAQMSETVLRSAAVDCIVLPGADANSILNATVLIACDGEQRLDEAVRAIDATASDALTIKMAGPLPACGFASLSVDLPTPAAIASACRRLGVERMAALDELRAAYYARMRAVHPDVAPAAAPDWDAKPDYDLLVRVRTAELALAPTGSGHATPVPMLKMLRADLLGLAA
jgi:hypothetical protein